MNIIEDFENSQIKGLIKNKKVAQFHPGDTVRVNVKVREGARERIQAFEGVCIARRNRGLSSTFTVRKISFGEGVERTFPLYGTVIDSITVIRHGKVRRAKLYYLRDRTGKSARIAERIRKKIGIEVDVKPEAVTEKTLAPVTTETEKQPEAQAEQKIESSEEKK